jgi:hypothetical protein
MEDDDMGELQLTRRAALAALGFAVAATAAKAQSTGFRFREIRVDVSPLHAMNQDDQAAWVAAVLPGYLRQTFAKYLAPGDRSAGVLVARIDDVSLGEGGENGSPFSMGSDTRDEIEGVGLVLDAHGRQVQSYPLLASIWAKSGEMSPYRADIDRRRAEMLARGFAQWLPGKMGL